MSYKNIDIVVLGNNSSSIYGVVRSLGEDKKTVKYFMADK